MCIQRGCQPVPSSQTAQHEGGRDTDRASALEKMGTDPRDFSLHKDIRIFLGAGRERKQSFI